MNKTLTHFIALAITGTAICTTVFGQTKDKTIATVGKEKLTADEYRIRYELMPHISQNKDLIDSVKFEFLYSLIGEKLWAREAAEKGYDTTDVIKYSMRSIEKLYVKDALYKEEVDKKITVTPQEVIKGTFRYASQLFVNIMSSEDSSEIHNIYKQLNAGAKFDSLLSLRDEYEDQKTPVPVKFGDMKNEEVEDILYTLKPGEYSKPVKTETGWFIFTLKDKKAVVISNQKYDNTSAKVKDIIKERRAKKAELKFMGEFMSKQNVKTDGRIFRSLVEKATPLLVKKAALPENKKGAVNLDENDVAAIMKEFGSDSLSMPFIKFEKDPASLKDVLYAVVTDGFTVEKPSAETVSGKIKWFVNNYIENETLSREGYRRGLQNLPEVKKEMSWWRENYISHLLKNQYLDSVNVSDSELKEYYEKKTSIKGAVPEVNIVEIVTNKLDEIEIIMNELQKGTDIKALARKYNIRESTRKMDGETGFFPVNMYGEIGKIAEKMKVGEVYGPLKVVDGYSIFKLIARNEMKDSLQKPFEVIKDRLKDDLFEKKLSGEFDKHTVQLASKYGVKINEEVLKALKVSEISMFTSRYMGFGGRIAAIPYTAPFYQWYQQFKKMKQQHL